MAPDGKIYACAQRAGGTDDYKRLFLVINNPNGVGFNCVVKRVTFDFGQGEVGNQSYLPNRLQNTFNGLQPQDGPSPGDCSTTSVSLVPNPVSNSLSIAVAETCFEPYDLKLLTLAGQVVYQKRMLSSHSEPIGVSGLAAGVYVAELNFTGRRLVKRWVKE